MGRKTKGALKPRKPRNPLAPQLWQKGQKVKPSAKSYSRKAKRTDRDEG